MTAEIPVSAAGPMPVLETARLRLRPYKPADFDDMAAMLGDREVTGQTFLGYRDRDQTKALLDDYLTQIRDRGWGMWTIRDIATDSYLGEAGLVATTMGGAGLRYALMQAGWGKGVATEAAAAVIDDAFGRVGMTAMIAGVKPANPASRRILEKLGFVWDREITEHGPPFSLMVLSAEVWDRRTTAARPLL